MWVGDFAIQTSVSQSIFDIYFDNVSLSGKALNVKFYDRMIPEGFQTKEITVDLAKIIYYILGKAESSPDEDVFIRGTLKGVSLISHWVEFFD
jgi:hypothetical protein